MELPYPLVPFMNFVFAFLVLTPLPWMIHNWIAGVWAYALWTSCMCFIRGINTVIWRDNVNLVVPVWCDIVTRIEIGASVALPAASFTITRRVYRIMSLKSGLSSQREKRKNLMFDLALCIGYPLLTMALYIVVEGHRFDIYEELGCVPMVVKDVLTLLIFYVPPIIYGLISSFYCVLIMRAFWQRKKDAKACQLVVPNVSRSRFYRMLALGAADTFLTLPLSVFLLCMNLKFAKDLDILPLPFYSSWEEVHYDFSRVDRFRRIIWEQALFQVVTVHWAQWLFVFCGFIFFVLFGLNGENLSNYINMFSVVLLGLKNKLNLRTNKRPNFKVDPTNSKIEITFKPGTQHNISTLACTITSIAEAERGQACTYEASKTDTPVGSGSLECSDGGTKADETENI